MTTTLKYRITSVLALLLLSCSDIDKKEKLVEALRGFEARDVPSNLFKIDRFHNFDILSQSTTDTNYNYSNTFVLGLYDNKIKSYTRVHVIDGFSPNDNYDLIKVVSNKYSSDTTYLNNIQLTDTIYLDNTTINFLKDTLYRISANNFQTTFKMKDKKYIALIYRKTNPLKDSTVAEWMMWKREIVWLGNNGIFSFPIDKMNEHLF